MARADNLPTFEGRLANSTDQTQGAALVGFLLHLEECQVGIDFGGNSWGGKISVVTASSLGPASPCLIGIDSTFNKGAVNLENLVCLDATTAAMILNSANGYVSPSKTVVGSYSYSAT